MPPRQRAKIMATSAMSIMAMPSCPAPLGSSNTEWPSPATASATCAFSQGAQGTVRFSWVTSICNVSARRFAMASICRTISATASLRSEEHTSELQSQSNLVCRLLLEKKNLLYERLLHHVGRDLLLVYQVR